MQRRTHHPTAAVTSEQPQQVPTTARLSVNGNRRYTHRRARIQTPAQVEREAVAEAARLLADPLHDSLDYDASNRCYRAQGIRSSITVEVPARQFPQYSFTFIPLTFFDEHSGRNVPDLADVFDLVSQRLADLYHADFEQDALYWTTVAPDDIQLAFRNSRATARQIYRDVYSELQSALQRETLQDRLRAIQLAQYQTLAELTHEWGLRNAAEHQVQQLQLLITSLRRQLSIATGVNHRDENDDIEPE
jgi:hypothetical protein